MNSSWSWIARYILVMLVALVIAGILGGMDLFKSAKIAKALTAAQIVKFLGYGGTLMMVVLLAQRAAEELRQGTSRLSFLADSLMPFALLIAVAAGHGVLLLVVKPFLDKELRTIYDWLFVAGCVATAVWLASSIFARSEAITQLARDASWLRRPSVNQRDPLETAVCGACGAGNPPQAKFCNECGKTL